MRNMEPTSKKIALLGCGFKNKPEASLVDGVLVGYRGNNDTILRVDHNPLCKPDFIMDLNDLERGVSFFWGPTSFDEVHAYEVWEHLGSQGDSRGFFTGLNTVSDMLVEDGLFILSLPMHDSIWALGDPDHKRIIPTVAWSFLVEEFYDQLGKTAASDFRSLIKRFWKIEKMQALGEHCYHVALRRGRLNELYEG